MTSTPTPTTTQITLTVMPSGASYEAESGITLLEALTRHGVMKHECDNGGKICLNLCHVSVLEGRKSLSKVQRTENERLDQIVGVGSKSRLACQAVLGEEAVTVELPTL
ncbi:MAG: ferredoxin [Variovorax sp.]